MAERYIMSPEEIAEEQRAKKSAAPAAPLKAAPTVQDTLNLSKALRRGMFGIVADKREKEAGSDY